MSIHDKIEDEKSSGILRKGNRLEAYRFMEQHNREFGVRWLLRRLGICPNAYYNYRKHRKADYYAQKEAAARVSCKPGEPQVVYGFHIFISEKRGSALQLQHC